MSHDEMVVWGRRSAFNVQKVLWLLGELQLPYRRIDVGGSHGGLDEPDFRLLNPHGRIPVLDHSGVVVWESDAILRYLAAVFSPGTFWPENPVGRAQIDQWLAWSITTLQRDFIEFFWAYYRTPPEHHDQPLIRDRLEKCQRHYALIDRLLLDHPYLAGEQFGLADVVMGTTLFRYYTLDIERPDLAQLAAYYQRLQQRPAYVEHVMVDYAELRGRLPD